MLLNIKFFTAELSVKTLKQTDLMKAAEHYKLTAASGTKKEEIR